MYSPINTIIKNNTSDTIYFSGTSKGLLAVTPNGTMVYNGDLYTALLTGRASDDLTLLMAKGTIEISYEIENKFSVESVDRRILTLGSEAEDAFLALESKGNLSISKRDDKVKETTTIKETVKNTVEEPFSVEEPVKETVKEPVVEEVAPVETAEKIDSNIKEEVSEQPNATTDTKKKRNKKIKVD